MKRTWFAIKMVLCLPILIGMGIFFGIVGPILMWCYHWIMIKDENPGPVLFGMSTPEMDLECQCPKCGPRCGY